MADLAELGKLEPVLDDLNNIVLQVQIEKLQKLQPPKNLMEVVAGIR